VNGIAEKPKIKKRTHLGYKTEKQTIRRRGYGKGCLTLAIAAEIIAARAGGRYRSNICHHACDLVGDKIRLIALK
jgi:hypothetical protein